MKPSIQPKRNTLILTGDAAIAAGLVDDRVHVEFTVAGDVPDTDGARRLQRLMTICHRIFQESREPAFVDAIEQLVSELPDAIRSARANARASLRNNCNCEKCRRARGEQPLQPTTHH